MINRLNQIKIHCWGGLGSQLNAWAIAEVIKQKYKHKSVELVFHTGGVTKRISELNFLSPKFRIKVIDDFGDNAESTSDSKGFSVFANRSLKYFLNKLGLVLNDETELILNRVKSWTLSLRGHYSYEALSEHVIQKMFLEIQKQKKYRIEPSIKSSKSLGIHYRLGDLVGFEDKSFINPEVLGIFCLKFILKHNIKKVSVYSDSPKIAETSLSAYFDPSTTYLNKDIWQTLFELCNHRHFIGTNSKISIWISLFRSVANFEATACLPISMKEGLHKIYPKIVNSKNTLFY